MKFQRTESDIFAWFRIQSDHSFRLPKDDEWQNYLFGDKRKQQLNSKKQTPRIGTNHKSRCILTCI